MFVHLRSPLRALGIAMVLFACESAGDLQAPCNSADVAGAAIAAQLTPPPSPTPDLPAAHLVAATGATYGDTVSVKQFGVRGDGTTDDAGALQNAINRASAGTALYFPAGTYVVGSGVTLRSGIALVSDGATLETRSNSRTALVLAGVSNVEIAGLTFRGPQSAGGYSRAIEIRSGATSNLIRKNHFKYYDGGAVVVSGDGNTVVDNAFDEANNGPPEGGAHYGSIHVINSRRNVIERNVVVNFDYSGISVYGASDNRIAHNEIHVRAGFPTNSMGIYVLAGSARNLIEDNEVSGARWEGIVLISNNTNGHVEGNVVRNNFVHDCRYAGVSLQTNGSFLVRGNWIEDNRVEAFNMPGGTRLDHAILLVGAQANRIRGNEVRSNGHQIDAGIRTMNGVAENVFENNLIEGIRDTGIHAQGSGSWWVENTIRAVPYGIRLSHAPSAVLTRNAIEQTTSASIYIGDDVSGARVIDNRVDRPISGATSRVELSGNGSSAGGGGSACG